MDSFEQKFEKLCTLIENSSRPCVFTGAGVSTLSGIPDFRGPHGVYSDPWMGMDVEEIISMTFFRKSPDIFYKWAKDVWYNLENYEPNIVHKVISRMKLPVYTQNIDMLHQKAGSEVVYEVHGSGKIHHCTKCGKTFSYEEIAPKVRDGIVPTCPQCGGVIKPNIVFYEEALDENVLRHAWNDFSTCDLCICLGSSLTVQPAASFPEIARQNGAKLVIVNAQETYEDYYADLKFSDLFEVFDALNSWLDKKEVKND